MACKTNLNCFSPIEKYTASIIYEGAKKKNEEQECYGDFETGLHFSLNGKAS